MLRGKKTSSHGISSDRALSGHLDDWEELAVDYVDGHLDHPSEAAVREHLKACTDCAHRLAAQRDASTFLRKTALADAPAELENHILSKVLPSLESARATRPAAELRPPRPSRTWLSTTRPWVPAAVAAVAVLALVATFALTGQRGLSQKTAPTTPVALTADAEVAAADSGEGTANARTPTTPAPGIVGMTVGVTESTEAGTGPTTLNLSASSASMKPSGPYLQSRDDMASGLTSAAAPAYFFFEPEDESLMTAQQLDTVALRVTAATGLQLVDQELSSGVRAFAAFVPREDASAVVDLLRSIGASLQLTASLSLQPGSAAAAWAETLLADKYVPAELSASPSQPPATAGWSYTTSTSPPTTAGDAQTPKALPLDEAGTHVLVVILVNVQM